MRAKRNLLMYCLIMVNCMPLQAQMPTWWGKKGAQVVTCRADLPGEFVMGIMDTRDRTTDPPTTFAVDWAPTAYHGTTWTKGNLGDVFGIAYDGTFNIYVTASSGYGMPVNYDGDVTGKYGTGGSGAIYKINATTGAVTTFATIPQDQTVEVRTTAGILQLRDKDNIQVGAGLGNICFDKDHNQFFVTSFDDGKIYRINSSGTILNSFDPQTLDLFVPDPSPTNSGANDVIAPLGDRVWGIGYYGNRVYFSAWTEDRGTSNATDKNRIYSVALDASGNFSGTERLELTMPNFRLEGGSDATFSNPISDIEFDLDGNMLVAERGMDSDVEARAHRANGFYFARSGSGTYTSLPVYTNTPGYIRVGTQPGNNTGSASGGAAFTYDGYNSTTMEASGNLTYGWFTGHRLRAPADDGGPDPDPGSGTGTYLSGSQMSPVTGFSNPATFYATSYYVDFDGNITQTNKTAQGDVDIIIGSSCPNPNCTTATIVKN